MCELTCDVQRVCKKKCEALLHATSCNACAHARALQRVAWVFGKCEFGHHRGGTPRGGPFSHFLQNSPPLRGQNSAATAAAAVFGLHHPVFALSTPETHFRTTFLRFRTTFLRFRQLFNKIFKNFYVLTLLFYKIIKKSGYPGGYFRGGPGGRFGGGPWLGFPGGCMETQVFQFLSVGI